MSKTIFPIATLFFALIRCNLYLIFLQESINAFGVPSTSHIGLSKKFIAHYGISKVVRTRTATTNYAIIYEEGHDGDLIQGSDEGFFDKEFFEEGPEKVKVDLILDTVSNEIDMQSLIRIACAFAPAPHNRLNPKDVIEGKLINLNSDGIEIAITVSANNGGLVQVLIPVTFSTPCDLSTSCVLACLQRLDADSYTKIAETEREVNNAELLNQHHRIVRILKQEPFGYDLPDWWTSSTMSFFLEEECSFMKDLLNKETFSDELSMLFEQRYSESKEKWNAKKKKIKVLKACVSTIGTSGLFLKAYYVESNKIDDDTREFLTNEESIMQLAIPFDEEVNSADVLRENLLEMVETAKAKGMTSVTEEEKTDDKGNQSEENFQRKLLEARLKYEHKDQMVKQKIKDETFQRKLLQTRLEMERVQNKKSKGKGKRKLFEIKPLDIAPVEDSVKIHYSERLVCDSMGIARLLK